MKRVLSIVGLLAVLIVSAYAQQPILKANVPFEFVAAGKVLPAGNYEFSINAGHNALIVRNADTGKSMMVHIMTMLAAGSSTDVKLTFDTVEGKKILEAVWPPDGDGYLLHATKGKHTHEVVKAAEKN